MNTDLYKFAVVGEQCSGKTSAAKFITRHFTSAKIVKFAQPLYDALHIFRMTKNRSFMQKLSSLVKEHTHEMIFNDIFQCNIEEIVLNDDYDVLVCDDVRFPFELTLLRKMGFYTIGIHAYEDVRAERAERLGLEFITNHESEIHALDCVKASDHIIRDEGLDIKGLYDEVEKILTGYGVPILLR